jgi:hypothetical protein
MNLAEKLLFYPAALAKSLLELKGTQSRIVVPPPGAELIESWPLTNPGLSRMLMSPIPS